MAKSKRTSVKTFGALVSVSLLIQFIPTRPAFAVGAAWDDQKTHCIPNFKMDKPYGYICTGVDPMTADAKMGLSPGDIVLQLDGRPLFDPYFEIDGAERALDLWREHQERPDGGILVLRGNKKVLLKKKPH